MHTFQSNLIKLQESGEFTIDCGFNCTDVSIFLYDKIKTWEILVFSPNISISDNKITIYYNKAWLKPVKLPHGQGTIKPKFLRIYAKEC